ncbi:MAG: VOC family protein [Demequinaceae bacterium]|nr:VOC family protein [Demequinaceae bacterium]
MIRFHNAIAFVESVSASTAFYRDIIGITPIFESETFVLFPDGFSIHDGDALHDAALGRSREPGATWGRDNTVYYFVSDTLDEDFSRVTKASTILHTIQALPSGELAFRCLDPDGHILEVGDGIYEPH